MINHKKNLQSETEKIRKNNDKLRKILYLSIAFSATIGGTTTLTSNGPNLVFKFVLEEYVTLKDVFIF